MIQELFHIGPVVISPFGVMLVLAFFSGYLQLKRGMKRLGVGDEEDASSTFLGAATSDWFGAEAACGDTDGDGVTDLLVGAFGDDAGGRS